MRQLKIIVHGSQGPRPIVLGRLGSAIAAVLTLLVVAALAITTFIFGYLLLGVVLAVLLVGLVITLIRMLIQALRP